MTDTVWASYALLNSDLVVPFRRSNVGDPIGRVVTQDHIAGRPIDPANLPQYAVLDKEWPEFKKFPPLFHVNEYLCVTGKMAQFLRQFDLGSAGLYPIKLISEKDPEAYPEPFYILGLSERKQALVPEKSGPLTFLLGSYRKPIGEQDDYLALNRNALTGPDLWTDPSIRPMFFVSQRLHDALEKAGLTKAFKLKRCKLVD
ncbi:hypothetical protein [Frigidibacter sp. SD6-1]|uniref:hypothetical protein n=1 Tax=Frigidibacter sp. SD6-1 TaxID=3032581 RepID=UPI0024DFA275|nr:hypothetical protein [Frigidibacter sp. SD6-1]